MLDGDLAQFFLDWISDPNRSLKDPIKKRDHVGSPTRCSCQSLLEKLSYVGDMFRGTVTAIGTDPYLPFLPILPPPKVVVGFYYIGKGIEIVVRMGRGGREGREYFADHRMPFGFHLG